MPNAAQYFDLPSPFSLKRGGHLLNARLAFETWGELNSSKNNAVLICTGMSPGAHAAANALDPTPGWWEGMIGPGKAIDTNHHFVICANNLGSCKGSTGPASPDPSTERPYRLAFPELCIEDLANANFELTMGLRISHLRAIIGPSMGGMTALAFGAQHPTICANYVLLSTAAHAGPFALAVRALQREIIRSDPHFADGQYGEGKDVIQGMRLARKLGVITYRSAGEWDTRFGRTPMDSSNHSPFGPRFAIESYLEGHADRFVGSFDPCSYLYLSRAMDWFDLVDYGGSVHLGLAQLQAKKALVIGVASDILFPLHQQKEIADGMQLAGANVEFHDLASIQGHDSFLVDLQSFDPLVRRFLQAL
jgi:homoserine O-acetyltransferase/O-succinyltransferase